MEKQTYLYEVMIRGTADGKISGAHMIFMDRYTDPDTKETVVEKERPAEKLDVAAVEGLLGKEMAKAGEQVVSLATEKNALEDQVRALTARRDELLNAIGATQKAFDAILNPT